MESAMQTTSNDQTVRSNTVQHSKNSNSHSLPTQVKKGEQLVYMMHSIKLVFDLMGADIVELYRENESMEDKLGYHEKKELDESKTTLLKQIDDEKKANLFMSRVQKHMKKH